MASLGSYKTRITKALKKVGRYSPAVSIQVESLASALLSLSIANKEIEGLDSVLLVNETTQGTTSSLHPAFRVQRDMQEQITKQMKALGLTVSEVVGAPDIPDAVDELNDILDNTK